jgi:hypothetical protein
VVVSVPAMEAGRFYHVQFIDQYTHNCAYVGTRATGNGAGSYLLAGPDWKGEKPERITDVIRCETQFAFILIRTQLFAPADIEQVKKIQAGYKVEPLSRFVEALAPTSAPAIDFPRPPGAEEERTSLEFFNVLNFVLQFCPIHPSEQALRARFATLGIREGQPFDAASLAPGMRQAVQEGVTDAWKMYEETEEKKAQGEFGNQDLFGTREYLKNNYAYRMTAAVDGIYGNSKEEAAYMGWLTDAAGQRLDGSTGQYTVTFAPDQLPPVNAFWSVTMYRLPARLLVANPLNRYLVNSPMLPNLVRNPDGGLTLYLQKDSPGKDKESNWLPAPNGPFMAAVRLYNPKPEVWTWKLPPLERQPSTVPGRR